MKARITIILFLVSSLLMSGCGAGQMVTPTVTSLPTTTPFPTATLVLTQTSTPSPTVTPVPTQTSTPIPTASTYIPVPRWMMLAQPGYSVEIFGEGWNYTNDRWGETYACMDYTREQEPYMFFEQCFALTQQDLTFEIQLDAFLKDDFETLKLDNTFDDVGQISLVAKRLEDNATKFVKFFELFGVDNYILLVEMNVVTDDSSSLQAIYEDQAAITIDYVLQNMLEKSRLIPRPTATPLSPTQESVYASLVEYLTTESEASVLYVNTWEARGDFVFSEPARVCRDFEDRTNADVLWVGFANCVLLLNGYTFEEIVDSYNQPGSVLLQSRHQYDDEFVLFGSQRGHTFFYAFLLQGEYVYFLNLESRTQAGQEVEDVFTEAVDDFIYDVLSVNAQR